ncbi:hypothetical protein A2631_04455 [Candidatus Daviesbacteria bacterium RIFCSPHIGHO2_01_FULL_44_29]|uniref:Endolytic murein transglycosylase n=1 Tax=Candidatus Daviesbacteria bacterium RIFCSPHIGHO2_02_FULL_43_12 TaxID=1797776 RepID=A0A1F5KGK9_9BACT|nr:MAG: hypothetical protein A2631_04455 [Candidatus Daviesbacteria bacterium RIFCSPHIGHO2_01_FULL_44_29]OGE39634.1 MAG: hypothetical protein A3E86_03455 [Candidatus Daviesbacteria bacterium RIFCSPHIGHO2_12_FULL_47_45]OGE39974.1 MAG: hypothetical protein A3D25_04185 [Candidatus Daviesbacteria bacterium RIFCSPHIGHO2_02_FULL_43_12]OGE70345.1 MAG: hypothetical protein A3B55_01385 [Candidatus Daviesbacteria bacterium RIFCSPLOWO2_01_FULL_43_15]
MKNRNFLRNWISLVITLVIVIFLGYYSYLNSLKEPVDPKSTTESVFVITIGESIDSIASDLAQDTANIGETPRPRLIRSAEVFKSELKKKNLDSKIQAGDYKLSQSMTLDQIIDALTKGAVDRWVTLLEGWRVEEMGEKLSSELGIQSAEFIKQAKKYEGYLFPDTYLFNKDATIETIISTLKNTFNQRYSDELQAKVRANGLTPDQGVILASIVEREARSDKVRTQVASILLKRFKIGMGLNVDAAIQYALGYQASEKSWWKKGLTRDDLKVDSPYNTYIHAGLPPTPICNPSLSSLQAVANASSTPYLYYFHDSQGNSYYAKTLEEHNANVANYR